MVIEASGGPRTGPTSDAAPCGSRWCRRTACC